MYKIYTCLFHIDARQVQQHYPRRVVWRTWAQHWLSETSKNALGAGSLREPWGLGPGQGLGVPATRKNGGSLWRVGGDAVTSWSSCYFTRCLGEYMLGPGHAKTEPMGHEIEELQGQRTIWTIVHNWVLFLLVLFWDSDVDSRKCRPNSKVPQNHDYSEA